MSTRRKAGLWSGLDRPILVIVIFLMTIGIVLAFAASPAAVERTSWIVAGSARGSGPASGTG